jgi:hypothetical protein
VFAVRIRKEPILVLLLVYLVGLSGSIGAICYLDAVKCGKTGDTKDWLLQLIAVVVGLLAGGRMKDR